MPERAIEAKRQVFLTAIGIGTERLQQKIRNATDEEIDNLYTALRIAPGTMEIKVEMPTGKDLL